MRHLIGFVGFKSSGKNSAAEALYPQNFIPFSFADALKDTLSAIFCWDRSLLEGITKESRIWREQVDPWWAAKLGIPHFTPRLAMTNLGTEVLRGHFHNDLWVFNVERRLSLLEADASVVLIDIRFPNEIALARRYGGRVIRITRGPDPEWAELATLVSHWSPEVREHAVSILKERSIHPSEFAWLGAPVDVTIANDGTLDELHTKVVEIIAA